MYKKRLVEVHEYLADQSTWIQLGKESYENFLIQQVRLKTQNVITHHFYSLFKKRIVMMNSKAKTSPWQYLMLLPILALSLSLFSFETYPVYRQDGGAMHLQQDSIPATTIEVVDTIIVFDPATKEETITYVRRNKTSNVKSTEPVITSPPKGIDTVIVFDPKTSGETMFIINHTTGKIDTIR